MRLRTASTAALLGAVAILAGWQAQANFLTSEGFSGRNGATCVSCHTEPPVGAAPAQLVVDGFPAAWDPGVTYQLALRIEGGPDALPDPAPKGGVELEADAGRLSFQGGLLRAIGDAHLSYTADGAMVRSWDAAWTAPAIVELLAPPGNVTLWAAGVAANGNHVVALGAADGGERFDAVASLVTGSMASAQARAAWNATPLQAPDLDAPAAVEAGAGWAFEVKHTDRLGEEFTWRLDGGGWRTQANTVALRAEMPGLAAGDHLVEARSEGWGRASPVVAAAIHAEGLGDHASPAAFLAIPSILLPYVAFRRDRP